jgi:hypothetical protein
MTAIEWDHASHGDIVSTLKLKIQGIENMMHAIGTGVGTVSYRVNDGTAPVSQGPPARRSSPSVQTFAAYRAHAVRSASNLV